jgi:hypothetical protein
MRLAELARPGFSIIARSGEFGSRDMSEGRTTFGAGLATTTGNWSSGQK